MLHSFYSQLSVLALALCCGLALLKGGPAEKAGAALITITWLAVIAASALSQSYVPAIAFLASDAVLAVGLLALAIRYSSGWLGAAMFLQSVVLALHAAHFTAESHNLSIRVLNFYILGKNLASCAMLATILAGTLASWRRRVRGPRVSRRKPAKMVRSTTGAPLAR